MLETLHAGKEKVCNQLRKRTVKNFMDILILSELAKAPMSGYDVITSIFERFNFLPSSGTVYSLLYALEREGLIRGEWSGRRRIYLLTSKGEEMVEMTMMSHAGIESVMTKIFGDGFP